jgi:O-antigen/teichoic acid export membrane protein
VLQASGLSAVVVAAAGAGTARLAGLGATEAWLVAAMIVTQSLSSVLADLGRGLGRVRAMAAIERIAATLSEIAGLAALPLFTGSISLRQALVVLTAAGVVPLVLLVRDVWGAVGAPFGAPEPRLMASLLSESWPVTVNGLLWRGLSELDLWLVGALGGAHAAGVYGVAMRLAAPLQVTGGIAIYVLSGPVAALHAAGRHQDLERLLRRAARWSTAVSAVGFLLIALAGPRGLALVFGPAFAGALPVFLVLGLAKLVNLAAGLGGTTLMMMGRTRTLMWISVASSTVTLALAAILLIEFGLVGAAVAALVGVTLQNAMMIAAVRRFAGIRVYAG